LSRGARSARPDSAGRAERAWFTPGIELATDVELATCALRQADLTGAMRWSTPVALRTKLALGLAW
jgi:hypothetical protein